MHILKRLTRGRMAAQRGRVAARCALGAAWGAGGGVVSRWGIVLGSGGDLPRGVGLVPPVCVL